MKIGDAEWKERDLAAEGEAQALAGRLRLALANTDEATGSYYVSVDFSPVVGSPGRRVKVFRAGHTLHGEDPWLEVGRDDVDGEPGWVCARYLSEAHADNTLAVRGGGPECDEFVEVLPDESAVVGWVLREVGEL